MARLILTALISALLPGPALSAPSVWDDTPAGQQTMGAPVWRNPGSRGSETLRGTVDRVDQGSNTISLRLSPDTTEQFNVQDGLLFDVARYGDKVEVTVQNIGGARTIVGLSME
jgi:hypothetical protein